MLEFAFDGLIPFTPNRPKWADEYDFDPRCILPKIGGWRCPRGMPISAMKFGQTIAGRDTLRPRASVP